MAEAEKTESVRTTEGLPTLKKNPAAVRKWSLVGILGTLAAITGYLVAIRQNVETLFEPVAAIFRPTPTPITITVPRLSATATQLANSAAIHVTAVAHLEGQKLGQSITCAARANGNEYTTSPGQKIKMSGSGYFYFTIDLERANDTTRPVPDSLNFEVICPEQGSPSIVIRVKKLAPMPPAIAPTPLAPVVAQTPAPQTARASEGTQNSGVTTGTTLTQTAAPTPDDLKVDKIDCADKNNSLDLQEVCANPELRTLDIDLLGLYKKLRGKSEGQRPKDLVHEENNFISERAQCKNDTCLIAVYSARIAVLKSELKPEQ
jgi:uncharacterized protein YecT (DUF1311 family)